MDEETYRKIDTNIKYASIVLSVVGALGIIISIYTGLKSQTNAINNQWGQMFYDEKMSQYIKVTESAARIAVLKKHKKTEELEKEIITFRTHFWGPMGIVEGDEVEKAMVTFNKGIDTVGDDSLETMAIYLAHICRNEARRIFLHNEGTSSHYGTSEELLILMKTLLNNSS